MPQWLQDAQVLEVLHREARDHLKQIWGTGRDLALKGRWWPRRGWGAFEDDSAYPVRLFYDRVEPAEFLQALGSDKQRRFLRGPGGEQALREFLALATSDKIEDRRSAAALARAVADALDPPRPRGQPSAFDSRRIAKLYRWRRRLNNARRRHLRAFITPPPAGWLPAFIVSGGLQVKMDDEDWAHLAAVEYLAAALDVSDHTVESHLKKARAHILD